MCATKIRAAVFIVCVAMVVHSGDAGAEKVKPEKIVYQTLDSHQPDDIRGAIDQIKKTRRPAGVNALSNRIRNGLPPDLLSYAIDALVEINGNLAAKTLIELSGHRSSSVRRKVASSLAEVRGGAVMKTLVELLDDENPDVRAQAATSIGKLKPQAAMEDLIAAAAHGVVEAAEVVGQRVPPARVPALIKMLDDDNIPALTPLFRELALRKDIPKKQKLALVDRLKEMSTPRSKRMLVALAASLPDWNDVKLAAADILIKEIDDKEKEKEKEDPAAGGGEGEGR